MKPDGEIINDIGVAPDIFLPVTAHDVSTGRDPDLDKALFFKGHELRELGSYEEMIAVFERLVRDHPKSSYRHQALIILGDYYFDKSSFPRAEDY